LEADSCKLKLKSKYANKFWLLTDSCIKVGICDQNISKLLETSYTLTKRKCIGCQVLSLNKMNTSIFLPTLWHALISVS
jgi:hypothetical protein